MCSRVEAERTNQKEKIKILKIRAYWREYLLSLKFALKNFNVWGQSPSFEILANKKLQQITNENQRESFFVQRFFAVKEMLR